jgi:peptidoglycan hydrolase-like protein with peptidoglycan-binding domain
MILVVGAALVGGIGLFVDGRMDATRTVTAEPARATPTTTEPPPTTAPTATTTTTEPPPTTTTTTEAPPPTTEPEPPPTTTTTEPEVEPEPEPEPEAEPEVEPTPGSDPGPGAGVLAPGDQGDAVLFVQQRLLDLGFWLPAADGVYSSSTSQAVLAFQKAQGLDRDGIAGPATIAALDHASRPVPQGGDPGTSIEIDLARQLLLVVQDGQVTWAINTSTGTAATPTRVGRFTVEREIDGMRHAPLGDLYRPKYFDRGIAVHGSDSIPGYPASHGCARVSNAAIDMLWASGLLPIGTPVWVY